MFGRHQTVGSFPILRECLGCGELFSLNHHCRATNEKCLECQKFGHYTGFCLQWKYSPPVIQPSFKADHHTALFKDIEPIQDSEKQFELNEIELVCRILPFWSISEVDLKACCHRNQGLQDELNHFKRSAAASKEENNKVQKMCDTLLQVNHDLMNNSMNEQTQIQQLQEKVKQYKTEVGTLSKSLDELKKQAATSANAYTRIIKQRNQLYRYATHVEHYSNTARNKVSTLVSEYEYTAQYLYNRFQPGTKVCQGCGSSNIHYPIHCIAQGNICGNCKKANHMTALCKGSDNLRVQIQQEDHELLEEVRADIELFS